MLVEKKNFKKYFIKESTSRKIVDIKVTKPSKFKVANFNLQARNFIKKESLAQVFSCEFCEISKNTFFTEHLRTATSGMRPMICVAF